ncbi:hypothetical protein [Acanthopleuribacter pedis]|uniref:Septum formation inhibitor Maf n=1 Tax=Acanthopleuribacter pedis TaxID=442870 RepID=A0A8J7Q8W4_9BACT|nr:hypothetical protein [Acanthopleuribacter pedis]MBO1320055.1 hypothetical protein [Acanthopleuribacter pedis]
MRNLLPAFLILCLAPLLAGPPETVDATFHQFWYQGKAELSRYELKQSRYGELREGDTVLIFVTEPLLQKEQVKRERGDAPADTVLKLNAQHQFNTGLYSYSLMTSTFTRVDYRQPETKKVTFTGQDWCGHSFMQINRTADQYAYQIRAYFQNPGDTEGRFEKGAVLEDELLNWIRLAPAHLPTGKIRVVPSLQFQRLKHLPAAAVAAEASLTETGDHDFGDATLYRYRVVFPDLERTLDIYFTQSAPFRIEGWADRFPDGGKPMTTTARRTHTVWEPYWNQNRNSDAANREKLGLQP